MDALAETTRSSGGIGRVAWTTGPMPADILVRDLPDRSGVGTARLSFSRVGGVEQFPPARRTRPFARAADSDKNSPTRLSTADVARIARSPFAPRDPSPDYFNAITPSAFFRIDDRSPGIAPSLTTRAATDDRIVLQGHRPHGAPTRPPSKSKGGGCWSGVGHRVATPSQ